VKFPIFNFDNLKKLCFIFALFFIAVLLFNCSDNEGTKFNPKVAAFNVNQFGFPDDSLTVDTAYVLKNQSFANVLLPFNVPYLEILKMASVDKDVFNARKITAGNHFFIYTKNDSTKKLNRIVYEKNPINYVIFDFEDSLKIIEGKRKVTRKEQSISAVINNSLFESIAEKGTSPVVALKLADVFAWQIDFYRIRKDDYFKVIYDEVFVDGKPYTIGKIKAALFNHKGKNYYAFYFNQENELDYFDESGHSLRKAFLKAPLKFSRISSRYSHHRYHPVFHRYAAHLGVDFAAPTGTPVHAIGDGFVIAARYKRGNGRYIKIKHNSTYQSGYLHLSRFAKGIKPGKVVKQGQTIGYVGMTGFATGPHLDLRFWKNGQLVDYLKMEFPPSKPIEKKYRDEFNEVKKVYLKKLNNIAELNSAETKKIKKSKTANH